MCNPLKDFLFCEYYIHKYDSYYENLQYLNYCKYLTIKCKCPVNKFNCEEWETDSNYIQQLDNDNNYYGDLVNL